MNSSQRDSPPKRAAKSSLQPVNSLLKETLPGEMFSNRPRAWGHLLVLGALAFATLLLNWPAPNTLADAQKYVPTYYVDVQPILEKNCVTCHTTGGIAPFSLQSPEEAVKRAPQIAAVVQRGYMPPWPPGSDSPAFRNERRLGEASKKMLTDWAQAGAPLGKK
jgi:mono/diheme cytochrome c family protein